jgi:hypothetical protein
MWCKVVQNKLQHVKCTVPGAKRWCKAVVQGGARWCTDRLQVILRVEVGIKKNHRVGSN